METLVPIIAGTPVFTISDRYTREDATEDDKATYAAFLQMIDNLSSGEAPWVYADGVEYLGDSAIEFLNKQKEN